MNAAQDHRGPPCRTQLRCADALAIGNSSTAPDTPAGVSGEREQDRQGGANGPRELVAALSPAAEAKLAGGVT